MRRATGPGRGRWPAAGDSSAAAIALGIAAQFRHGDRIRSNELLGDMTSRGASINNSYRKAGLIASVQAGR